MDQILHGSSTIISMGSLLFPFFFCFIFLKDDAPQSMNGNERLYFPFLYARIINGIYERIDVLTLCSAVRCVNYCECQVSVCTFSSNFQHFYIHLGVPKLVEKTQINTIPQKEHNGNISLSVFLFFLFPFGYVEIATN